MPSRVISLSMLIGYPSYSEKEEKWYDHSISEERRH